MVFSLCSIHTSGGAGLRLCLVVSYSLVKRAVWMQCCLISFCLKHFFPCVLTLFFFVPKLKGKFKYKKQEKGILFACLLETGERQESQRGAGSVFIARSLKQLCFQDVKKNTSIKTQRWVLFSPGHFHCTAFTFF